MPVAIKCCVKGVVIPKKEYNEKCDKLLVDGPYDGDIVVFCYAIPEASRKSAVVKCLL